MIGLSFLSCEKTKTETIEKIIHDTVFLKDTLFLHDTITQNDTMFLIDSIIFYDTTIMIDTIVIHDTVIINDTNEFAYLFKHYELDTYDVLFYRVPFSKSSYEICKMNSDQIDYEVIDQGLVCYPIWSEDGQYIYYIDYNKGGIVKKSAHNISVPGELVYTMDRNVMFLRHHEFLQVFLFSYKDYGGLNRLLAYDYNTGTSIELTQSGYDETNPTCSKVDDWIYFSKLVNDTRDIYRKKLDGSNEEVVYEDPDFSLAQFDVSSDGKFLITPKYRDGAGYVVFYDIKRERIIYELELPTIGTPQYASLSKDNKAIFFVNGTPDYSEARNIYRMGLDGTQFFQMTHFTDRIAGRPLVK